MYMERSSRSIFISQDPVYLRSTFLHSRYFFDIAVSSGSCLAQIAFDKLIKVGIVHCYFADLPEYLLLV